MDGRRAGSEAEDRALFGRIFSVVYARELFDVWAVRRHGRLIGHAEIKPTDTVGGHEIIGAFAPSVWGCEDPLLLVLDEPTSAMDADAEHTLFERCTEQARRSAARSGAITLLVSHRFSTVRSADLILVVANGRLVESGTHPDLVRADGMYAELCRLQARAYM